MKKLTLNLQNYVSDLSKLLTTLEDAEKKVDVFKYADLKVETALELKDSAFHYVYYIRVKNDDLMYGINEFCRLTGGDLFKKSIEEVGEDVYYNFEIFFEIGNLDF